MKEKRKHLYYLHELSDYKVDSEDPDVRGWKVKDLDNRIVGKVDNLLVNKESKRVVYLDIEVDDSIIDANHDPYGRSASDGIHEFINKEGETHLILPIGLARLNREDKYVYTDRIDHQTFAETKRMAKGADIDRDYEVVVLESYNRDLERDRDEDTRGREETVRSRRDLEDNEKRRVQEDEMYEDERRARERARENDDDFYDRGEFDRDRFRK